MLKENLITLKHIHITSLLLLFVKLVDLQAQTFLNNPNQHALTFKEMQLQFSAYKQNNDLKTKKYWKQFKRYEADMQLHTNTQGEPAGFDIFIYEAIKASQIKSQAKGQSTLWFPAGPNSVPNNLTGYMENGIGRVNCVAFSPTNTNTYYVGVAQGGIWKTTNGGASYTPLTDNLPITKVSDICLDPNNNDIIYASICDFAYIDKGLYLDGRKRHTHYGLGVYKSVDGGQNWNPTGLTFQLTNGDASLIKEIVVNPNNSSQVLACGVSGMYKSNDGGQTWTKKLDSLFWDMIQDPLTPGTLYAASGWIKNANIGNAGIYKTTDFGNTWTLLNTGMALQGTVQRIKLAIAPSDANYVYAICCDNTYGFYGIYKSTNAGVSWIYQAPQLNILEHGQGTGSGGQGTYDLALIVDATDKNKIYTGGVNIWGSIDGGLSFNPCSHWTLQYGNNTVHADIHSFERQPGTNHLFVCCDGGLYKTANLQIGSWNTSWTTQWINLSDGMQCTSFYRLSSSKNKAGRIIAGAQDNATFYYDGANWSTLFGGDGMDNYLDPLNNQNIIGSSQFGNFYYSGNGPQLGTIVGTNPNNESSEWVAPIVAAYNYPGVLYVGNENVVQSTDGGQSWNTLASFSNGTFANTEISALAVAPSNSNIVYAARRVRYELNIKGVVFKTLNGNNFGNITGNLPDSLFYTSMDVSSNNADVAVISMAGFSAGKKVYKTTMGGFAWTNISYNLPNVPVNCVKYDPSGNTIFACTDVGVFALYTNSTSWVNYSLGLPNVIVTDIEFNPAMNLVYVSTFGRGIWESSMSQLLNVNETTIFSALDFQVYPSISSGKFSIALLKREPTNVEVIDVNGRIVYKNQLAEPTSEINLNVPSGAYYIKAEQNGRLGVKKIIIE